MREGAWPGQGPARDRRGMFQPASVVNVSAMSFGALSAVAIEAINRGCVLAGCLQNTGEGGLSPYHLFGGELVFFNSAPVTSAAATGAAVSNWTCLLYTSDAA